MFAAQRDGTLPILLSLGARFTLLQRARFQTQASVNPPIFLPGLAVTLGTSLVAEALPVAGEPRRPGSGGRSGSWAHPGPGSGGVGTGVRTGAACGLPPTFSLTGSWSLSNTPTVPAHRLGSGFKF